MSIAEEIFAVGEVLKREPVKAWQKDVFAWELTAAQRDEFESSRIVHRGKQITLDLRGSRAKLVALSLRESGDDKAPLVFTQAMVERLGRVGGKELDRVYAVCAKLSGIAAGDDDEEPAAAKN
jgi:hypothetical protein